MIMLHIDRKLNYGRHILEEVLGSRVTSLRSATVLDIGAGSGLDLDIVNDALVDPSLHAVEVYPPNVEKLRAKGIQCYPKNLEKDSLPFEDTSIDLVIANQIAEHCKEIFWIFHEMARCLKIGGYLYLGVPNLASLHSRLLLLLGRQPTCIRNFSAHVRGFTKRDVEDFFDRCFPGGFDTEVFRGANFYPFPPRLANPLARLFPSSAVSIFFLLKKRKPYKGEFLYAAEGLETNFYRGGQKA